MYAEYVNRMVAGLANIKGYTVKDIRRPVSVDKQSMISILNDARYCFKVYTNASTLDDVKEDMIAHQLWRRLGDANFQKYTAYISDGMFVVLEADVVSTDLKMCFGSSIPHAFQPGSKMFIIVNVACVPDSQGVRPRDISPMVDALNVFHRHGIFHRDIKKQNTVWCNDVPKFIDFNVAYVDDGSNASATKNMTMKSSSNPNGLFIYSPKPHPTVNMHVFGRSKEKAAASSEMARFVLGATSDAEVDRVLRANAKDPMLPLYLLHKNDLFMLLSMVMTSPFFGGSSNSISGGGLGKLLTSCMAPPKIAPTGPSYDCRTVPGMCELLISQKDYDAFKKSYYNVVSTRLVGGGGRPLSAIIDKTIVAHIRVGVDVYVVREDTLGQRYIMAPNGRKVLLSTIHGKYRYVR